MGLRDKLLAATKRKREPVPSELAAAIDLGEGETLYVAECTARDLDDYQAGRTRTDYSGKRPVVRQDLDNTRAKLLVKCLVDEQWRYVLKPEDAVALGELPATVLDPLYAMAVRLCGLAAGDDEALSPNADAPSASLSPSANGTLTSSSAA